MTQAGRTFIVTGGCGFIGSHRRGGEFTRTVSTRFINIGDHPPTFIGSDRLLSSGDDQ